MSAQSDLMSNTLAYSNALQTSVGRAKATGQLDGTSMAVLQQVSKTLPGAAQAYQISQTLQAGLNKVFGQGSTLARAASAALNGGALGLPKAIASVINGRTYQSDQYEWAQDYLRLVKGQKVTSPNQTGDSDVLEAITWAVNKTGIPISGREHIMALNKSPQAYMDLYKVNPITSTDPARVQAAYQVVQQYMMYPPDPNQALGAWADTIGVYDQILVNAANGQATLVAGSPLSALTNPPPSLENQQITTQPLQLTNGMVVPAGTPVTVIGSSYLLPALLILGAAVLIIGITWSVAK